MEEAKARENEDRKRSPEIPAADGATQTEDLTDVETQAHSLIEKLINGKDVMNLGPYTVSALNLHAMSSMQVTLIQSLRNQVEILRQELKTVAQQQGSEGAGPIDARQIKQLMREAFQSMRDHNTDMVDEAPEGRAAPPADIDMDAHEKPGDLSFTMKYSGTGLGTGSKRETPADDQAATKDLPPKKRPRTEDSDKTKPEAQKAKDQNMEKKQQEEQQKLEKQKEAAAKKADSDTELDSEELRLLKKSHDDDEAEHVPKSPHKALKFLKATDEEIIQELANQANDMRDKIAKANDFLELKSPTSRPELLVQNLTKIGRISVGKPKKQITPNSLFACIVKEFPDIAKDGTELRQNLVDHMSSFSLAFVRVSSIFCNFILLHCDDCFPTSFVPTCIYRHRYSMIWMTLEQTSAATSACSVMTVFLPHFSSFFK